ncbi:hypothetical protein JW964_06260 [candidate division KSB1 bacterium]|nr:hypothetical protein [candidate division KSB1 bacterium]
MSLKESKPAIGKLMLKVPLALESPLMIGNGESENSDIDVLKQDGKPLIPATSIVGVFRAYLENGLEKQLKQDQALEKNFIFLFGDRDTKTAQSALQCDDIILKNAAIPTRDGVKIDPKTNLAMDQNKYNYELVEHKTPFNLQLEITIRDEFDREIFKRLLLTIFEGIGNGQIRLGAKTNKGFGKLKIEDKGNIEIAELDFSKKSDLWQWLSGEYQYRPFIDKELEAYTLTNKEFTIDAWFKIKNSFLIRSYPGDPFQPDAVPIKQNDNYVLPGTSVMGAVRHRALKILKTLALSENSIEEKMQDLFGFEGKPASPVGMEKKKSAKKGRLVVEETIIKNVLAQIQTRIKIDRFTGGTIEGALFEMMPLWQNTENDAIHIVFTLKKRKDQKDFEKWEAGLLLYILKDLWTGDLAIGGEKNVGRGVLEGYSAVIKWDGLEVNLTNDHDGRLQHQPKEVDAFKKLLDFAETCGKLGTA